MEFISNMGNDTITWYAHDTFITIKKDAVNRNDYNNTYKEYIHISKSKIDYITFHTPIKSITDKAERLGSISLFTIGGKQFFINYAPIQQEAAYSFYLELI